MFQTSCSGKLLAGVIVALLGCSSAYANLIVNGDFEVGDLSGWSTSISDFALEQEVLIAPANFSPPLAGLAYKIRPGSQSENAGLAQEIATESGKTYAYSFSLAARDVQGSSPLGEFNFLIKDNVIESVNLSDGEDYQEQFSGIFKAGDAVSNLEFRFNRPFNSFTNHPQWFLDNVVFEVIPEPSTSVLAAVLLTCGLSNRSRALN